MSLEPALQKPGETTEPQSGWMRLWLTSVLTRFHEWIISWRNVGAILAVIAAFVVLAGRAGMFGTSRLVVEPVSAASSAGGIIYFLPRTALRATITYQITKCAIEKRTGSEAGIWLLLDAAFSVEMRESARPDPSRAYIIRSDSMSGGFWNSDVAIELQNGLLKSVNLTSTSTVGVPKQLQPETWLAHIASSNLKPIPTGAGDEQPSLEQQRIDLCGANLIKALDQPDPKAGLMDQTKGHHELLFEFDESCSPGSNRLDESNANNLLCVIPGRSTVGTLLANQQRASEQLNRFNVQIQIQKRVPPSAQSTIQTHKDVVYATPGVALIGVCLISCRAESGSRLLGEKVVAVAQWGREAGVAVERRLFSNRSAQIEFAPTGELVKAKFSDIQAVGADEQKGR